MPETGAERLVKTLIAAGVRHLFSLSGNQILSIYDATIGRDIDILHTRHEAAAVHMADGWGRLTEQPGVALLTAGPGHCNAIGALYAAKMAESPVLLLSGHSPRSQMGMGAFQEIDQVAVARPVTKASWLVEDTGRIDDDIHRALFLACSGRPGPVHVSLPADVLEGSIPAASEKKRDLAEHGGSGLFSNSLPDKALIKDVINLLLDASNPLILAGPAMARQKRWLVVTRLSEAAGIPALPMESPRGVNDPWLHMAANCISAADVVLLIGKDLNFSLRFGGAPFSSGCKFIRIDSADIPGIGNGHVEISVTGDPVQIVQQLTEAAGKKGWKENAWQDDVEKARRTVPSEWDSLWRSSRKPVHPLRVCEALQPFLDDGAIFISDGGEFGQWAQAGLKAEIRLINGLSGAIGSALPMGLAAKLAYPRRQVFVILGDGTFGYHALEFDTALRYNLPIIAIVGNDALWNAEHQLQVQHYGADRTVGCELLPTRYDKVAASLGGYGEFVERPDDLTSALHRAVKSGLPACVNVALEGARAPTFLK